MNNSFRTALFDFDGTLVYHKPDSFQIISDYCSEAGRPLSPEAEYLGRRMRHQYFVDPEIRTWIRSLSRDEFWRHFNHRLLEAMGVEGDLEGMAGEISNRIVDSDFGYYCPEAGYRTLTELHNRGYRLGLITNRDSVEGFHKVLDATNLRPYFDLILASGEVGIRKPEPEIFHTALDRLGSQAGEAFYVGDNYWADVVGAQRAGLTPVLLDPEGLFPEADCLVLERIEDLLGWLS